MNGKIRVSVTVICIIFALSFLTTPTLARPSEPLTYDYAEFRNDPYAEGTFTMTIYYRHDSYCNMYIYLYNPNDYKVKTWVVDRYDRSGYLYYTASHIHGVWRVQCYMSGYQPYWTSAALFHKFSISDPEPNQNNLGSDWARHPQNSVIYEKALEIINQTTSVRTAAYEIYEHVLDNFDHSTSYNLTFRSDLELLDDLNTYGHYRGVCRSDAVILTAYARAVGIPARIIYLEMRRGGEIDPHYFAEFYITNALGVCKWTPVDGDPVYNWFDQPEANEKISINWPNERPFRWQIGTMKFITEIPYGGIQDDIPPDCVESYPNWSQYYTNKL